MLPKATLEELREILRKEYNVNLADVETEIAAINLFYFFKAFISIDRNNRKSLKQKRRKKGSSAESPFPKLPN